MLIIKTTALTYLTLISHSDRQNKMTAFTYSKF